MFTGIIESTGTIRQTEARGQDRRYVIACPELDLSDVICGDSIAVSGVCLTVVETTVDSFSADVSLETLSCTTLSGLEKGDCVNLEKALLPTTRLGGHLVSGHVDGVGTVISLRDEGRSVRIVIEVPDGLARYLADKGSVCVDGTSLTVNQVEGTQFDVNIIPHTMSMTVIGEYRPGCRVNIEVDLLARYLERLLQGETAGRKSISEGFLAEHGYMPG